MFLGNTALSANDFVHRAVEAADLIIRGLNGAITSKRVTYDFARLMEGATKIKCSDFGTNIIDHM